MDYRDYFQGNYYYYLNYYNQILLAVQSLFQCIYWLFALFVSHGFFTPFILYGLFTLFGLFGLKSSVDLAINPSLGHLIPFLSVKYSFIHFIEKKENILINKANMYYYQRNIDKQIYNLMLLMVIMILHLYDYYHCHYNYHCHYCYSLLFLISFLLLFIILLFSSSSM